MLRRPLLAGAVSAAAATRLWLSGADAEYAALREDALPRAYDPAEIDAIWSAHPRVALARVGTVTYEAAPLAARVAIEWARRHYLAVWLPAGASFRITDTLVALETERLDAVPR